MLDFKRLSKGALTLAICMALTPAVFSAGPIVETRFFPVVRDTQVTGQQTQDRSVIFRVWFRKARSCEFLGLAWYDGDVRLRIDFDVNVTVQPALMTRPPGGQDAGPWRLQDIDRLDGTRAYALHRCHPLWITISNFYGH